MNFSSEKIEKSKLILNKFSNSNCAQLYVVNIILIYAFEVWITQNKCFDKWKPIYLDIFKIYTNYFYQERINGKDYKCLMKIKIVTFKGSFENNKSDFISRINITLCIHMATLFASVVKRFQ